MLNPCTDHTQNSPIRKRNYKSLGQLVQRDRTLHHLPWLSNLPTKALWYSIQGSLTCPTTTVSGFSDGTHLPAHVGIQALMSKFLSGQAELLSAVKTVCTSLIINHYYDCSSNRQWWIYPVAPCGKKGHFSVAYFHTTPALKSYVLREH